MFKQTEKIIKLLNLTTSDNDNEALLAVRMANKIVKGAESSWEQIIMNKKEEPKKNTYHGEVSIYDMLNVVLEHQPNHPFIISLKEQFENSGYLTPKQLQALKKFYINCL